MIRCARLRGIAHGGQTVLSSATRDLVGDRLPEGVVLRDLGSHRLEDLAVREWVLPSDAVKVHVVTGGGSFGRPEKM